MEECRDVMRIKIHTLSHENFRYYRETLKPGVMKCCWTVLKLLKKMPIDVSNVAYMIDTAYSLNAWKVQQFIYNDSEFDTSSAQCRALLCSRRNRLLKTNSTSILDSRSEIRKKPEVINQGRWCHLSYFVCLRYSKVQGQDDFWF